jgi:hypothetical protein
MRKNLSNAPQNIFAHCRGHPKMSWAVGGPKLWPEEMDPDQGDRMSLWKKSPKMEPKQIF